jgi:chemotaxis protein methyltransferase CheR
MQTLTTQELKLKDTEFRKIKNLVYEHCGIYLSDAKKELVRTRLSKRLRQVKISSFRDYLEYVLNDSTGREFTILIDSISTNFTSFFREQKHFDYLKKELLPQRMKKRKSDNLSLIRTWSAGCSSGEEPYTIAITLHEFFQDYPSWNLKILASDISTRMLQTAQRGIYEHTKIKPLTSYQKNCYLEQINENNKKYYRVKPVLKKYIIFNNLNLIKEWPIKVPLDFIFCRNVMIYFDKSVQEKLINRFWDNLDYGGVLFTGHSESLTGIRHKFKYIQPTIYMKT